MSALLISASALLPIAIPASASAESTNLIANSSVESADPSNSTLPQAWQEDSWGTNQPTHSYLNNGQDGGHSVRVQLTGRSSGDAKWYFDPVAVNVGSQYTYSDYYQSGVQSRVVVQFDDGKGNYMYQELSSAAKSTTWKQYTATFSVPSTAVNATVFHLIDRVGTLTTDNFSLTAATPTPPPPPPTSGDNLIANASVETPDPSNSALPQSWSQDKWGTNRATYSYLNTGQNGTKSMKVQMTSRSSGDAKWYFKPVDVQQNVTYTFSDYYQSNVQTRVVIEFDDGNGNYTYQDLPAAPASTTWKQYTATFVPPANAKKATVFHLIDRVGTLTTDNFSLTAATPTPPPPPPTSGDNLIANASVENPSAADGSLPQGWQRSNWGTNTPVYSYLNTGQNGSRSVQVQLTSHADGDAKWYFDPIPVQAGISQYAFSNYYKSSVPTMVYAVFTMSDGSMVYRIIGQPGSASDWQKFETNFSVPAGAVNVTVFHLINQVGTLTTDNFSLIPYVPAGFNRALVSLTFDDGYASTYTNGLPILQKYGFPSTQYITTGLVGQPNYMTQANVQAWHANGHEIASHTVTHPDLTQVSTEQLNSELAQSQATLQGWLGSLVTNIAYPYGLYNDAVVNTTKQYYSHARGVESGFNGKDNLSPYNIRVQYVFNTTTTDQIVDWVAQAQQTKTWLVLVYHSIDPSANPYGGIADNVTPAQLDAQLGAIKASGAPVVTMHQAFTEIKSQL